MGYCPLVFGLGCDRLAIILKKMIVCILIGSDFQIPFETTWETVMCIWSQHGFEWLCLYSIIAVSYEARARGVTRNMWADDAKKLCPDLRVARVREAHGKADLTQ